MKKKYESPTLEIAVIKEEDIICTSGLMEVGNLGHEVINFEELGIEIDLQ